MAKTSEYMNSLDDNKCLASWAVLKELSDNDRRDVYEILRDFIKSSIYIHGLRSFTISDITAIVNSDYDFNVKNAIIAHAIGPLKLAIKDKKYLCDPNDYVKDAQIAESIKKSEVDTQKLLDKLLEYIHQQSSDIDVNLSRNEICHSFARFILDNNYEDKYSTYISAFVIKCNEDKDYAHILKRVLDGVVLYSGITFSAPVKASSKWRDELTLYLDTEVLFHMAGFNGALYKQLFDDFYELVKEINTDSKQRIGKNLIHLKYFPYVPEEIEKFFLKAIEIVKGRVTLIPSVQAMKTITEGCKSETDVLEKKAFLLGLIDSHHIVPDSFGDTYYKQSSYAFNIESRRVIDGFLKEHSYRENDVIDSLISLSHINVLRGGRSKGRFEKLRYYLLTENSITKQLARFPGVRNEGESMLCTDLYFITNRIWYQLGKSFGSNNSPKVFSAISKAQIVLSTKVNNSVYEKYEQLVDRFEKKEISREMAAEMLYQLRSQVRAPEDVNNDDADATLMNINEDDISKIAEEDSFRKERERKAQEENIELKKSNTLYSQKAEDENKLRKIAERQYQDEQKAHEITKAEKEQISKEAKERKEEVDSLIKTFSDYRNYKNRIDAYKKKRDFYQTSQEKCFDNSFLICVNDPNGDSLCYIWLITSIKVNGHRQMALNNSWCFSISDNSGF